MVAAAVGLSVRALRAVRVHVRRVLHPRLRLHPDGRHLPGEHPPVRLARGRRDRRGRAVPDGPRGPGHDARRARAPPCCTRATPPAPPRSSRPWPTGRASATCGPPAAPTRCSTTPRRRFPIGGSKVLRSSPDDQVTLIGAGVTLHACLAAADAAGRGRHQRPGHRPVLGQADRHRDAARGGRRDPDGRLVVAEDHHPEGGLGSAVLDALLAPGRADLPVTHLAVREMPGSGHQRGAARRGRHQRPAHRRRRPAAGRVTTPLLVQGQRGPCKEVLMQAIVVNEFGGPDVLQPGEAERPARAGRAPGPGAGRRRRAMGRGDAPRRLGRRAALHPRRRVRWHRDRRRRDRRRLR